MDKYIALAIDVPTNTEIILIGTHNDILSYINESNQDKVSVYERELGSMLFELNTTSSNNVINSYLSSLDNYHNELDEPFINDSFIEVQRHLSLNDNKKPNVNQMLDYLNLNVSDDYILEHIETDSYLFIITDCNILALIKNYLRILYQHGLYPRVCMRCGKKFIANAYKLAAVLCSEQCRRKALYEQQKAYRSRRNDFEKKHMKIYQKWHGKISRIKKKNILTDTELNAFSDTFDKFKNVTLQMKKDAKNGIITPDAFEQWLSDFDTSMTDLFSQIEKR